MEDADVWSTPPEDEASAEHGGLAALLRRTDLEEPDSQKLDVPIVCRLCGWDQFEVAAGECFCEACCVPLGIQDGDVYSSASVCSSWSLAPSDASRLAGLGGASVTPADTVRCPAGHDLFHVAAACTITANGQISHLSVGLRCLVDGALRLYVDNARLVRRRH